VPEGSAHSWFTIPLGPVAAPGKDLPRKLQ
jgi:hypothetical protein